jgi:hypothetical protein
MATLKNDIDVMSRTYEAAGTISAGQPVGIDGAAAAAAAAILGIAKADVVSGDYDSVLVIGECELVASAAITAGAEIECAGTGQVRTLAAGQKIGRALTAAAAGGDVIKCYVSAI